MTVAAVALVVATVLVDPVTTAAAEGTGEPLLLVPLVPMLVLALEEFKGLGGIAGCAFCAFVGVATGEGAVRGRSGEVDTDFLCNCKGSTGTVTCLDVPWTLVDELCVVAVAVDVEVVEAPRGLAFSGIDVDAEVDFAAACACACA